jgi:hypothetical protein
MKIEARQSSPTLCAPSPGKLPAKRIKPPMRGKTFAETVQESAAVVNLSNQRLGLF